MIKIYTNSFESGDWIIVRHEDDGILHDGHNISVYDLQSIPKQVNIRCDVVQLTDEEIQSL